MKRLRKEKRNVAASSSNLFERVRAKLRNASEQAVERQKETLYATFFHHLHEHPDMLKSCSEAVESVDFCDRFRGVSALSKCVISALETTVPARTPSQVSLLYSVTEHSKFWKRLCDTSTKHEMHELCRRMTFQRIREGDKSRFVSYITIPDFQVRKISVSSGYDCTSHFLFGLLIQHQFRNLKR